MCIEISGAGATGMERWRDGGMAKRQLTWGWMIPEKGTTLNHSPPQAPSFTFLLYQPPLPLFDLSPLLTSSSPLSTFSFSSTDLLFLFIISLFLFIRYLPPLPSLHPTHHHPFSVPQMCPWLSVGVTTPVNGQNSDTIITESEDICQSYSYRGPVFTGPWQMTPYYCSTFVYYIGNRVSFWTHAGFNPWCSGLLQ